SRPARRGAGYLAERRQDAGPRGAGLAVGPEPPGHSHPRVQERRPGRGELPRPPVRAADPGPDGRDRKAPPGGRAARRGRRLTAPARAGCVGDAPRSGPAPRTAKIWDGSGSGAQRSQPLGLDSPRQPAPLRSGRWPVREEGFLVPAPRELPGGKEVLSRPARRNPWAVRRRDRLLVRLANGLGGDAAEPRPGGRRLPPQPSCSFDYEGRV